MPVRHEETTEIAAAGAAEVFPHLDDQRRLSAHMSKRSWMTGWGKMELRVDAGEGKAVGSHIARGTCLETDATRSTTNLRVLIDYDLPSRGVRLLLGRLFGRMYARWCTRQMVHDAQPARYAHQRRSSTGHQSALVSVYGLGQ